MYFEPPVLPPVLLSAGGGPATKLYESMGRADHKRPEGTAAKAVAGTKIRWEKTSAGSSPAARTGTYD